MDEKVINLNFEKICRSCLQENDVKNIFQDFVIDDEKVNLQEIITFVTSIEVNAKLLFGDENNWIFSTPGVAKRRASQ